MNEKLFGERIYLRSLSVEDCSEKYLRWLNDPEVSYYSQRYGRDFVENDVVQYIKEKNASDSDLLLGIFLNSHHEHIGNILLSNIDTRNKLAEVSWLIGEKEHWGKGYASEAGRILIDYAFNVLQLNKLYMGTISGHDAMINVSKKLGFKIEGILRENVYHQGNFVNTLYLGLLKSDLN